MAKRPIIYNSILLTSFATLFFFCPSESSLSFASDTSLRTDSRSPYLHRISLYDEDGTIISPDDFSPAPYSPRATCGKCHDYGAISSGWHFNARQEVSPGRPAQPWILADQPAGTQIPLSERIARGTHSPDSVGLANWNYIQEFGTHMPGNSMQDVDDDAPDARWFVSGNMELDCMICHAAASQYDYEERAAQIARQNFKWLPTATNRLAVVRGDASKAPDDYDPFMPPDPDFPERSGPQVEYAPNRFDADDRVVLQMDRKPSPERCYYCHTNRIIGENSAAEWTHDEDVHLSAGMTCTDCHRHGIDHAVVRGYEGEERQDPLVFEFSCEGCHLGTELRDNDSDVSAGRFGAPRPLHKGLPPVHFDKLSCTACHSGPLPGSRTQQVQTSRANSLGIADKHRSDDAPPHITQPVFIPSQSGKVTPHRLIWKSFFAVSEDEKSLPLPIDLVKQAVAKIMREDNIKDESDWGLDIVRIGRVLSLLKESPSLSGEPVYLSGGQVFSLDNNGKVTTEPSTEQSYYAWPLAHDVRPARQSLGASACTECHSASSEFFFGEVAVRTPLQGFEFENVPMHEFIGISPTKAKVWGLSFMFRPFMKIVGWSVIIFVGIVLLLYLFAGVSWILKRFSGTY